MRYIVNLLVLAALGWAAWYGYTHLIATSDETNNSARPAQYNCRQALAKLAEDYKCRNAASCTLSSDQISALKDRELAIAEHCN